MPFRARNIAGLAITATIAGAIATAGLTTASAASLSCTDLSGLSGTTLTSCIHDPPPAGGVRRQDRREGRRGLPQGQAADRRRRRRPYTALDSAADRATVVAQQSRARAAAVAAQLARTGGSVGQTTEVLLSGDGASSVLYHLSRMSEMTAGHEPARRPSRSSDQAQADDLSQQAEARGRSARRRRSSRRRTSTTRRSRRRPPPTLLVAKAEEKQSPGSNAAYVTAYADLPSDASVAAKVVAFARAQIGEPVRLRRRRPELVGLLGPHDGRLRGRRAGTSAATA